MPTWHDQVSHYVTPIIIVPGRNDPSPSVVWSLISFCIFVSRRSAINCCRDRSFSEVTVGTNLLYCYVIILIKKCQNQNIDHFQKFITNKILQIEHSALACLLYIYSGWLCSKDITIGLLSDVL